MNKEKETVETEEEDFFDSLFGDETDGDAETDDRTDDEADAEKEEETGGEEKTDDTVDYKALYEQLKNESERDKSRINDAAKRLGYDDADHLLAESKGQTVEEYKKTENDELTLDEAKKIVQRDRFERVAAEDLSALKAKGYIDADVKRINDIPGFLRFAKLRDMGLSAEEAFRAVNGDDVTEKSERRAQVIAAQKQHLTSTKQKAVSGTLPQMTSAEREEIRELTGVEDDKELEAIWKRARGIK